MRDYSKFLNHIEELGLLANSQDAFNKFDLEEEIDKYLRKEEVVGAEAVEVSVSATLRYVSGYLHENGNYGLADIIGSDT